MVRAFRSASGPRCAGKRLGCRSLSGGSHSHPPLAVTRLLPSLGGVRVFRSASGPRCASKQRGCRSLSGGSHSHPPLAVTRLLPSLGGVRAFRACGAARAVAACYFFSPAATRICDSSTLPVSPVPLLGGTPFMRSSTPRFTAARKAFSALAMLSLHASALS